MKEKGGNLWDFPGFRSTVNWARSSVAADHNKMGVLSDLQRTVRREQLQNQAALRALERKAEVMVTQLCCSPAIQHIGQTDAPQVHVRVFLCMCVCVCLREAHRKNVLCAVFKSQEKLMVP